MYDEKTEKEIKAIEDEFKKKAEEKKAQYLASIAFKKRCEKKEVIAAARKAVEGLDVLHKNGIQITDWSKTIRGFDIEIEDLNSFDRYWISA